MKISQLIKNLQDVQSAHGDIIVLHAYKDSEPVLISLKENENWTTRLSWEYTLSKQDTSTYLRN